MEKRKLGIKYSTGNWIYVTEKVIEEGHYDLMYPDFSDEEYRLIHKKHKDILDAFLADNDVEVEKYKTLEGIYVTITGENFIEHYNETWVYRLKQDKPHYEIDDNIKDKYDVKEHETGITLTHKENMFAKYGFEKPDFECEILGQCDLGNLGTVKHKRESVGVVWDKEGRCFELGICNSSVLWGKYNLAPIKKPWYEDESNFPCLMKDNKEEDIYLTARNKEHYLILKEYCRLATQEEVLSLYKEVK